MAMRLAGLAFAALLAAAVQGPDRVGPPPPPQRARPVVKPAGPPPPSRPAQSLSGGLSGTLTGFPPLRPFGNGLSGLPATGDAAPQCRAVCARAHNLCAGGGDESCDSDWAQCVVRCRTGR